MGKSTKRKYNKHFEKHQLIPGKKYGITGKRRGLPINH